MYQFQHYTYFWLLIVIILIAFAYIYYQYRTKKKLQKIGDEHLVKQLIGGHIKGRKTSKLILTALVLLLVIFGLANLQKRTETEEVKRKGIDVVFALDVSKSMLAKDVSPDRLSRAKQFIARMIDKMKTDRVGLVVFAGKSYLQVPLTIDYGATKMILSTASPDIVPSQGTVLSEAIEMANETFSRKERKFKAIILITDGEDHDIDALKTAKTVSETGTVIYTVGIGSPEGTMLMEADGKTPKIDNQSGQPVVTKLNEDILKSIANTSGGSYQLLYNVNSVSDKLIDKIEGMEKDELGTLSYVAYASYFQYFLLASLVLLIIDFLLPEYGKNKHS